MEKPSEVVPFAAVPSEAVSLLSESVVENATSEAVPVPVDVTAGAVVVSSGSVA